MWTKGWNTFTRLPTVSSEENSHCFSFTFSDSCDPPGGTVDPRCGSVIVSTVPSHISSWGTFAVEMWTRWDRMNVFTLHQIHDVDELPLFMTRSCFSLQSACFFLSARFPAANHSLKHQTVAAGFICSFSFGISVSASQLHGRVPMLGGSFIEPFSRLLAPSESRALRVRRKCKNYCCRWIENNIWVLYEPWSIDTSKQHHVSELKEGVCSNSTNTEVKIPTRFSILRKRSLYLPISSSVTPLSHRHDSPETPSQSLWEMQKKLWRKK